MQDRGSRVSRKRELPNPGDEGILGSAEASTMERKFHEDPTKHWVGDTSGSKGIEKAEKAKEDQISRKQIVAWSADWQRVAAETRAKGEASSGPPDAGRTRAYAYTNLLTAFAEGLEETRLRDPRLPRYVIAIRFIGALEKLIGQQPDAQDMSEARQLAGSSQENDPLGLRTEVRENDGSWS